MHALTLRGVEVETVLPGSPAAHAGLRPARELTAREKAVAMTAGLLTLTPAAAVAPSLVRFSGGIPHGDIILAVNGRRVSTQNEFQTEIERVRPQDTVYFTVHRGETNVQVSVRLTESPTAAYAAMQQ
jgi:S1-C subfamily serine protease